MGGGQGGRGVEADEEGFQCLMIALRNQLQNGL
jgi:hypothetical protein